MKPTATAHHNMVVHPSHKITVLHASRVSATAELLVNNKNVRETFMNAFYYTCQEANVIVNVCLFVCLSVDRNTQNDYKQFS